MEKLSALYASALFELALERSAIDDFLDQAIAIRDTLSSDECLRVLMHPHVSAAQKHDLFAKAFSGHIHDDLLGFLFLISGKNRERFLIPALTALIDLIERHNKKVTAKVLSAVTYDEKQITALESILSVKTRKSVDVSLKVDPSVIGGPHIYVDGCYLDWTVKKRIRDLTVHMKEGCSV